MKRNALSILLLGVTFLTMACGSDKNTSDNPNSHLDKPRPTNLPDNHLDKLRPTNPLENLSENPEEKIGGKVDGQCTLTGDIRSFEINSPKQIKHYTFFTGSFSFTVGKKTIINQKLNGIQYDMNIEPQGTKLVGSEKLADKLDLVIVYTDFSECSVSLWVAK